MSSPNLHGATEAERRVGEVLAGKWRLERVLGAGGMATVFAATHVNNGRVAAIKVLHPQLAANPEIRARFSREGRIANKVGHPGVVSILDDGVDDAGGAFLVMDLLVGESLGDRRERAPGRRLPEDEVLFVADGVLDVLAAAHEHGIVHRDLKPDNIFLTEDGAVKVLDFGIARLHEPAAESATRTGLMIGTPAYMPPEQARGRANLADARSDIWALGAILFTLLTGRSVHDAETPNEMLLCAMTGHAPALRSVMPDASPAIAAVVDRALAFEPEDRWPDARSMQRAARGARGPVVDAEETEAEPPRRSRGEDAEPAPDLATFLPRRGWLLPQAPAARALLDVLTLGLVVLATANRVAPAEVRRVSDSVIAWAPSLPEVETSKPRLREPEEPQSAPAAEAKGAAPKRALRPPAKAAPRHKSP